MQISHYRKKTSLVLYLIVLFSATFVFAGCDPKEPESNDQFTSEFLYQYYQEVCAIPRSGSEYPTAINNYIMQMTETAGFDPILDEDGNVIVEIPASEGLESLPLTILQTRTDANINSSPSIRFDPGKQGVDVYLDTTSIISAEQMSMGADSSTGIASLLALMYLDKPHGPLRLLFTAYGSTTMSGAANLDKKYLEGGMLINFNGITQDQIQTGSQYAAVMTTTTALEATPVKNRNAYVIAISGYETHPGENPSSSDTPVAILTEILSNAKGSGILFELSSFTTVTGDDPWERPSQAIAVVVLNDYEQSRFRTIFNTAAREYGKSDNPASHLVDIRMIETLLPEYCITNDDFNKLLACLFSLTSIEFSSTDGILPTLSVNNLSITPNRFLCSFLIEANSEQTLEAALIEQAEIEKLSNIHFEIKSNIPGALPPKDASTIEVLVKSLNATSGQKINVLPLTAISEGGYFYKANPNLEIISIGTQISNVDHINEFVNAENLPLAANSIADYLENSTNTPPAPEEIE